jgi:dTMP kinase
VFDRHLKEAPVSSFSGVLIAFEGGDGAGKSTQATLLVAWLTERGHEVVATRQPGGTPVGSAVRAILLEPATGRLSPRTEALLYAADKAEHVDTVVLPALERGAVVVTDRYVDSTLAYQGAGRALAADDLRWLVDWATRRVLPDLTVLLDVDSDTGGSRLSGLDRLEAEPADFHRRIRQRFHELAEGEPHRYLVCDGRAAADEIAVAVRERVHELLASRTVRSAR